MVRERVGLVRYGVGPTGESSRNIRRGAVVTTVLVVVFGALMVGPRARTWSAKRTTLYADFRTTSGLRAGSPVQLAGVEVGRVHRIDFVQARYACDPLTEDLGRFGHGRTDSCDQDLFCSPMSLCADLEPYSGKGQHARCDRTSECAQNEVCLTTQLRRRAPHVLWAGPRGVCARYSVEHTRTRVELQVPLTAMDLVRADSRATIASNSVLGDQMVSITAGRGDVLCPRARPSTPEYAYDACLANMRVQARPSVGEDVDRLRRRVDSFMDKADLSILAIANVIDELRSEETLDALRGTLANLAVISRDVAYGEGLIGAMLSSPQYREDIGLTLRSLNLTSQGLEQAVSRANRVAATLDSNLGPVLADTQATLHSLDMLLADLDDPANRSLGATLLREDAGRITEDLEHTAHHVSNLVQSFENIAAAVDEGDGTLGLLVNDDRVIRDAGRLLHNLARHDVLRAVTLWYLERKGAVSVTDARAPGKP